MSVYKRYSVFAASKDCYQVVDAIFTSEVCVCAEHDGEQLSAFDRATMIANALNLSNSNHHRNNLIW